MRQLPPDAVPPLDFWDYFEAIPPEHFEGHDCSEGKVTYAWEDASARYQHVLINSEDKNIFMVIVLDLKDRHILGHRLLDLNRLYGLKPE